MKLYDEGEKLTREELQEYQEMLDLVFTEDYIEFMLANNGGSPEESVEFDFIDESNNKPNGTNIREFYSFFKEGGLPYLDIMKINCHMREEGLIGKEHFVFADDAGGNQLCMSLKGKDCGAVYFCDHEYEDADTGYLLMSKVADSFHEFLSMIREVED